MHKAAPRRSQTQLDDAVDPDKPSAATAACYLLRGGRASAGPIAQFMHPLWPPLGPLTTETGLARSGKAPTNLRESVNPALPRDVSPSTGRPKFLMALWRRLSHAVGETWHDVTVTGFLAAVASPILPEHALTRHLMLSAVPLERSSRAAAISFDSYPCHSFSFALYRRTISASFCVASWFSFWSVAVLGNSSPSASSRLETFGGSASSLSVI